jgi:DNA-binding transcriptional MerR regulator
LLTIKSFSRVTAIPESTLRYYDEQGILRPSARGENGYRLYQADQILPAKFLYSLRLAEIPIDEVRAYQQSPPEDRQEALARWHSELGERIAWLTLARKYVEGLMQGREEEVVLQVTQPERVVWFTHDAPIGCFGEHYVRRSQELRAAGFTLGDSYFRYVVDLQPGWVRGEVGFQVSARADRLPEGGRHPTLPEGGRHPTLPEGARVEERPSALMLSLAHRGEMSGIRQTYIRLLEFLREHGWEPVGPPTERYPADQPELYTEVVIPILYLER